MVSQKAFKQRIDFMVKSLEKLFDAKVHGLKTEREFFVEVVNGVKTFEVRLNDRDYKVGDILLLTEYQNDKYTGDYITKRVTYILDEKPYVPDGYVVMAIGEL